MKKLLIIQIAFCALVMQCQAQRYYDSLQQVLRNAKEDSNKVLILYFLSGYHESTNADSNYYYVQQAMELSRKINFPKGIFLAQFSLSLAFISRADYNKAYEISINNLKNAESITKDRLYYMACAYSAVSLVRGLMGIARPESEPPGLALKLQKESGRLDGDFWGPYAGIGLGFNGQEGKDSALHYLVFAYELSKRAPTYARFSCLATAFLANFYSRARDFAEAKKYFHESILQADYYNNVYIKTRDFRDLAVLYIQSNIPDSAIYFGNLAINLANKYHFGDYASSTSDSLAGLYESMHRPDSALRYMKIAKSARDSIFSQSQRQKIQRLITENEQKQRDAEAARLSYQNNVKLFASLAAVIVFLLLSGILYRNNRQQKKANALLVQQRKEIEIQRTKAEDALEELKSTQTQLVQREKMASLGELTAGVAHEIQNPLNFVNNFSEVNAELLDEMEAEFTTGKIDQARHIAGDLRTNLQKVIHYGRRADGIVKGMLQHSHVNTGQKELIALNPLVEEFLRVSYHGQKARDIAFQATVQTHFDENVGEIEIIPQDIGRVLQNLFNNAFYAVNEKKKTDGAAYQPTITISTKKLLPGHPGINPVVELKVRDNGIGISEKIVGKIFQPFFTNKPTGQGTGLGLSIAYDIITKVHGGAISVETRHGEYAEFIIHLPLKENN